MKVCVLFFLLWQQLLCFKFPQNMVDSFFLFSVKNSTQNNRKLILLAHTNKNFRKLGRDAAQRKALLRSLTTNLLKYGKIVTTEAKAKEARKKVERIITYALKHENNKQYAYRLIANYVYDREIAYNVVRQAPIRYRERRGGYTKIKLLVKSRKGDAARMALLELV